MPKQHSTHNRLQKRCQQCDQGRVIAAVAAVLGCCRWKVEQLVLSDRLMEQCDLAVCSVCASGMNQFESQVLGAGRVQATARTAPAVCRRSLSGL